AGGGFTVVGHLVQAGGQLHHLARRQERPRRAVVGHDPDAPVNVRVAPRVVAVDAHRAGARRREPGAQLQRGRLAGTVVAEQPDHSGVGRERNVGQRDGVPVPARDAGELDRRRAHPSSLPYRTASTSTATTHTSTTVEPHTTGLMLPGSVYFGNSP